MRAHFFTEENMRLVFFPDALRYYEINSFTEGILKDIINGVDIIEICSSHSITKSVYEQIVRMIPSDDQDFVLLSPTNGVLNRLVLNITNTCNMACTYCYANGGSYLSKDSIMSADILNNALELFFTHYQKINSIQLFGGEPFLNLDNVQAVCEFVEKMEKEKQPSINIVTNGTLLTEKHVELINRYAINITVSIDGPASVNDRQRVFKNGTATTKIVEKNIHRFKTETHLPIMIEATYTNQHEACGIDICDVVSYCAVSLGADNVHIAPVAGGMLSLVNRELIPQAVSRLFDMSKEGIPLPTMITKVIRALKQKRVSVQLCDAGVGTISVASNGNVYPCFMFTDVNEYIMGNVLDENLFDGESFIKISKKMKEFDKLSLQKCSDCFCNTVCSGCIGSNYLETGDIHTIPDQHCENERNILQKVIAQLVIRDNSSRT